MKQLDYKELLNSTTKSLFGLIPYAGTTLTELVFEYNGRVKQKRLNHFIEILSEGFMKNSDINLENIKTENFNDLFEAVVKRVIVTKSELKLKRFKDILIHELKTPTDNSEFVNLYLDLITNLSEDELFVLYEHRHFDEQYIRELENQNQISEQIEKHKADREYDKSILGISQYPKEIYSLQDKQKQINSKHAKLKCYRNYDHYGLGENKFRFYLQRLYSQGLLIDIGIGTIGIEPFHMMSITEFGIEFINYIKESD